MEKSTSLKDRAIAILHEHRGQWPVIASETGLDYNWLSKLSQGRIDDPGVKKCERLIEWSDAQLAA